MELFWNGVYYRLILGTLYYECYKAENPLQPFLRGYIIVNKL